ncbi:hypothetical protein [Kitasatospora cineracea]|uniref:hypothetical protein n=1 Tax=Kitasatospora cineracea TaxID=88074 RepID=UPI0034063337
MIDKVEPAPIKRMWTSSINDATKALEAAAQLGIGIQIRSEYHPDASDTDSQTLNWEIILFDEIPEEDPDSEE